MEQKAINLKTLTMDELAGVVNLYPWYGAARKELCRRMAGVGGESWGVSQFSDQAMYVGDRGSIAEIMHKSDGADYSDKGLEALLSSYIEEKKKEAPVYERKVHVVGGDFFSQSEYEKVKKVEDNVFARFQPKTRPRPEEHGDVSELDFCTETLAQIYAEQGYFEQAKRIYGRESGAFADSHAFGH